MAGKAEMALPGISNSLTRATRVETPGNRAALLFEHERETIRRPRPRQGTG